MVRIALLNLTSAAAGTKSWSDVGQVIRDWLAPAMPADELITVEVANGQDVPAAGDFDGYVLGGSELGVYDDAPWMTPLRQMLLEARAAEIPLFGICFGHQLMADTFGGKAEQYTPDDVVGARQFNVAGQTVAAHVWHKDQVTKIPPGAKVVGGADYCPVGALAYDFPALSVQFHPEYRKDFLAKAFREQREVGWDTETLNQRLDSINSANVAPDLMARQAAQLLRSASKI